MDVYLLKVDANANSNKFYLMHDSEDGFFTCTYGRVGANGTSVRYPIRQWEKKYSEKIKKGYKDISALKGRVKNKQENTFTGPCSGIMNELMSWAKQVVSQKYIIKPGQVSPTMIEEAYKLIQTLNWISSRNGDLEWFNDILAQLFNTLPRVMNCVDNYLAHNKGDYRKIILRETELLDVMSALVPNESRMSDEEGDGKDLFDVYGLKMEVASDDELEVIKSKVDSRTAGKVSRAWRVVNKASQEKYDQYIKNHNIKKTMLLWHGSGNENWFSIIKDGLKIRPSGARYTGSMFGDGIYFATRASKSFGYTSFRGSYWRGGSQDKAFMALFEVASGNQYDVYSHTSKVANMTYLALRSKGDYHCLFAHKGDMLKNDEIVFYRPDQVTIKYLVEFI